MSNWTPTLSPTSRMCHPAYSSTPFNEDAPWFMCKGRTTETYLGSESFKKFHTGQIPIQTRNEQSVMKLMCLIQKVQKSFILIKNFYVDDTSHLEIDDISGFVRKLRKSVCTSLSYILNQLQVYQSQYLLTSVNGFDKDTSKLLSSVVKEIKLLLSTVGSISDISNIRQLSDFKVNNQSDECYYHYVHASFDIWWNSIAILQVINAINFGVGKDKIFCDNVQLDPFMQVINSFLNDFTYLAVTYYLLNRKSPPFPCECFQEFWIMLINIFDKEPSSENNSFWFVYTKVIQQLLDSSSNGECADMTIDISSFIVKKIEDYDLTECCLWLTSSIATLHKYDLCGNYCESKTTKSGYGVLKLLVNRLLSLCTVTKVEQIRFSLFHIMQLISLFESNYDVILKLMDFFMKRLSDFFPSSMEIKGLSYMFKNSRTWFQHINGLSSSSIVLGKETSFDTFLQITMKQLSIDSVPGSLWRVLKGRIYSMLPKRKIKELPEVGLQNCFSLLLSIATSGQMEVVDKICELAHVIEATRCVSKQVISWNALFVLMHVHKKKSYKLNKIITEITMYFHDACSDFSVTADSMHKSDIMNLSLVYIDRLGEVFEQCHNLSLSEYQLIGSGISMLLTSCGVTEVNNILNVFLNILIKVKNIVGDNYDSENYVVQIQYITFTEFIFTHIFPFIKNVSTTKSPPKVVSDIAVLLMSFSYKFASLLTEETSISYSDIFLLFATKETVNMLIVCRFLCQLLNDASLVECLKSKVPVCQIIFQLWLKCVIHFKPPCPQMKELTSKVLLLNDFVNIFPRVLEINVRSPDYCSTSIALFRIMGETYEANPDLQYRKHLRETMLCYFKEYVPCVLKKVTICRDGRTLSHVYKHISHLVEHCSSLLHMKCNTESILSKLIDKTVIPHLAFPKDQDSQTILYHAIKVYLPNFIRGLFKLDYKNDMCIQREVKDIMVSYVCYYPPKSNPITELIIDTVNGRAEGLKPEAFDFLLEIIRVNVLFKTSNNAMNGFAMLNDVLKFAPSIKKDSIITVLLNGCLEQYMKQKDLSSYFQNLIKELLEYFQGKDANDSKIVLVPVLQRFMQEKLPWATAKTFRFLDIFVQILPDMFANHIFSILMQTVLIVEHNRGSGPDEMLRGYVRNTVAKVPKSENTFYD